MVTVDELVIKIGADTKGALVGIAAVESSIKNMDSTMGASAGRIRSATATITKSFALVGAAATALGVATGASFTKQSADMESYMITIKQLTGSQEKAAEKMKWLLDFAKSTPFELPGLIEATVKLGAYGIEAESVLKTLGDTASAMGKPINMAVEALADAQTGEFERMKEFGIKAVVVSQSNAEQLGATAEQVGLTALSYVDKYGKQQASIIDRNNREQITSTVSAIWNDKYAGGMEKQAMSMKGMVSNIKDAMYQGTLAIMGFDTATGAFKPESLFIKAKDAVRGLLDSINSIDFSVIAARIQGYVNSTISTVSRLVTELSPTWDNLNSIFTSTIGILKDVFTGFSHGGSTVDILVGIINTLTGALAKVFSWLDRHPTITKLAATFAALAVTIAYLLTPIGWITAAIAGMAIVWDKNLLGMRSKLETTINFFISAYNKLVPILNKVGFDLETVSKVHFGAVAKTAKDAATSVEESTTEIASAMTSGVETGLPQATQSTVTGSAGTGGSLADAWLAAGNFISGSGEYISKNKMGALGGGLGNTASSLAAGISSGMTEQATQATQLSISTILSQSLEVHKSSNAKLDMLNKLTEVSAKLDTLKIEVNNYVTNVTKSSGGFGVKESMKSTKSGA